MKKLIIKAITSLVLVYLLGLFTELQFNPSYWPDFLRFSIGLMWVMSLFYIYLRQFRES